LAAHTKQEEDLEAKLTVSRTEIVQQTDAEQIVRSALTAHLKRSPYLTVDSAGALTFDERKLVQRLESLFLTEIVDGIEQEEGRGFLTRARQRFEHVLSHWGEMEDLSEIAEVDWIESIILSRIRGYRVPVFPHFVVAKYEERPKNALGKKSVDTALAIDSSGSMDDNYRFEVAKKAAMATTALLRQLNPKNATYVSHFNNEVYDLSSPELLRQTNAGGGTRTEKALEWMIERLKDSGPSLAYLITDGDPNDVTATIAAAGKFKERPILLRIFLVDGNARTEEIIREIGRAAGPRTKVIPVRYDALGKDVLRDVSTSIGQMAEIAYF
ncbi:MAG TPA: vWA domain-containing protein, partial [Candidatus Nanoarchaeia archaeon]|nr:vWA domain-containing protein [Candidatus Nanoarchaeia archaeon]